jgi:hypothetical protein
VAGSCECRNKPSGSIKFRQFLAGEELLASEEELCCMGDELEFSSFG